MAVPQSLGATVTPDPCTAPAAGNKAISDTRKAIAWAITQGNALEGAVPPVLRPEDPVALKQWVSEFA